MVRQKTEISPVLGDAKPLHLAENSTRTCGSLWQDGSTLCSNLGLKRLKRSWAPNLFVNSSFPISRIPRKPNHREICATLCKMWFRVFALLVIGSGASSLEEALDFDDESTSETSALSALQKKAEKTEEPYMAGPVHCICKDHQDLYYCAKSFAGFSKCYQPCPELCTRTGGREFMCGGKHENMWLDRYFKDQEESNMRCKLDPKKR
eukprot:s102_g39.t1